MKFIIKSLLSIYFISLALSASINREKRRSILWKGDEGSGSWDTYYDCPRINVAETTGQYINQGAAKIYAKNIIDPKSDTDRLGLVLDFSSTPANQIKKIATLVSGNKYYIPYRYFKGDIKYTNPSGDNKYLEGTFNDDDRKIYRIKIELPYKRFGWFISDEEAQTILNSINKYAVQESGIIKTTKNSITTESSVYLQKKPLYEAAIKNKDSLATEYKKQEEEMNSLKVKIDSLKASIEVQKTEINKIKTSISEKEGNLSVSEDESLSSSKKFSSIGESIEQNQQKNIPLQTTINDLKKITDASVSKVTGLFNTLRVSAPIRKSEVDKAEVSFKAINNNDLLSNLNRIYP